VEVTLLIKQKMTKKYILMLGGLALGAVAGFSYWYYIGCNSGTCVITSSPVNSSIYGAVLGVMIANLFQKETTVSKP
jgi:hypothetical protein